MFIDTGKNRFKLIKSLGLLVNEGISGEYDFLQPPPLGEIEEQQIIGSLRRGIGSEEILDAVNKSRKT